MDSNCSGGAGCCFDELVIISARRAAWMVNSEWPDKSKSKSEFRNDSEKTRDCKIRTLRPLLQIVTCRGKGRSGSAPSPHAPALSLVLP